MPKVASVDRQIQTESADELSVSESNTQTDVNSIQTKSVNCNIIDLKYTKQIEN